MRALLLSCVLALTAGVTACTDDAKSDAVLVIETKAAVHKMDLALHSLAEESASSQVFRKGNLDVSQLRAVKSGWVRSDGDSVVVDIVARNDASVLAQNLRSRGVEVYAVAGRIISAAVSPNFLATVADYQAVHRVHVAAAKTSAGRVTTQGDRSMQTDRVRETFDVDGSGLRVGALSDSFNCRFTPLSSSPFTTAAEDFANDELPRDVDVLSDITNAGCTDEGRAILQLVHDVAPGARGAFHTAFNGQADYAEGIRRLAVEAGSDIIVDDVFYTTEPMFSDGIVAQAVNQVRSWGVAYYSAASNHGRKSYESPFRPSAEVGLAGVRHDFDPGPGVDTLQSVTVAAETDTSLSFQWNEPYFSVSGAPGSASDIDVLFYFDDGSLVPVCNGALEVCQLPGVATNTGGDPIELPRIRNTSTAAVNVNIAIELFAGTPPTLMKYIYFEDPSVFTLNEFDTQSGTVFGHMNATGAETVGAAAFTQTEEFPQPAPLLGTPCVPACVNDYSSAGGTPVFFDTDGNPLPVPEVRLKPGVVGPDGGNTSFFFADSIRDDDNLPNFFGTSAAAPHVAAAAALVFERTESGLSEIDSGAEKWTICERVVKDKRVVFKTKERRPKQAQALIESGKATFRACGAFSADEVITLLRATAQDMRLRAFPANAVGEVGIATEVDSPEGFDFDTGFGMVDLVAAFEALPDSD